MKIFRVGSRQFWESLRELWVLYWSSRERPFREWNLVFREWNFQFRELLREYPGTLPELREWPFHSESVFSEIGVVLRLLTNTYRPQFALAMLIVNFVGGTVAAYFALIALVAFSKYLFDSTLRKLSVHPKYGWKGTVSSARSHCSGALSPQHSGFFFGQEKTNKHKHFRQDGVRDKQEPSRGQMGPLPGQNGTRPWDKPAFLCWIPQ